MKIWLDDIRTPDYNEDDYVWIKSVKRAIELISLTIKRGFEIEKISLDHDMGDFFKDGGDGVDLLNNIEKNCFTSKKYRNAFKNCDFRIHSTSPVGRNNMQTAINSINKICKEK